jgi:hypothetical protein
MAGNDDYATIRTRKGHRQRLRVLAAKRNTTIVNLIEYMLQKEEQTMHTITITITEDCEDLMTSLQRTHEYELISEDYNEEGEATVVYNLLDGSIEAMKNHLDAHPGVIVYTVTD